jgi:hypothetical protein
LLLLLPFAVRRATNHNPAHANFINACVATRFNIATTKTANERIGEQKDTNKNASDLAILRKKREEKKGRNSTQNQYNKKSK